MQAHRHNDPRMRIPGPDHPITVVPTDLDVVIRAGGRIVARSERVLVLREAGYPPVFYLPIANVDMNVFEPSSKLTYCPYKGDCSYFDLVIDGERIADVAWTYPEPYDTVRAIAGHLAFYPDRVDAIEVGEAG